MAKALETNNNSEPKPAKSKPATIDLTAYDTRVCGQHSDLIKTCKLILKNGKKSNDDMTKVTKVFECLKQSFSDVLKAAKIDIKRDNIGVSLGGALKDRYNYINGNELVIIKLIMNSPDIDCKQRTFVSKSLDKKMLENIYKALYKYKPELRTFEFITKSAWK
mmetsp:Transcript_82477/g.101175  ORF Transcript_82477/g.101175 Transcript_82477/m.101175 type:complete len:163 (-) Transcript_82477:1262-1750(-)